MDSYFLFRENKRLTLKQGDMTASKIARIFMVDRDSLYISDDNNIAIFPSSDGDLNALELQDRGRYEVHGESVSKDMEESAAPWRFSFFRPFTSASSSTATAPLASTRVTASRSSGKMFQRNIYIADVVDGKLETNKTLNVRFSESEASVEGIQNKVNSALDEEEILILTDGHGKKILDSDGTKGSSFWRQNARKIFAVRQMDYQNMQGAKKRRLSRREDTSLDGVREQIEEIVFAAQQLQQVSTSIQELVEMTKSSAATPTTIQASAIKNAFCCVICKEFLVEPLVSTCCNCLVGCKSCVQKWQTTSAYCPHCRAGDFSVNTHVICGLSDALAALKKIFQD